MIEKIQNLLIQNADKNIADWNYNYMRKKFEFYGIYHPVRVQILQTIFHDSINLSTQDLISLIFQLVKTKYRENFYTAIDLITYNYQRLSYQEFQQLYSLIEINPWWDTIDRLQKPFSLWIQQYPEFLIEIATHWNTQDLFWFKRMAIIIQLRWKENTDTQLLSSMILSNKDINEFFIQKAIGWVLREFSKTNPNWVGKFLLDNRLSTLAVREASKHLNKINIER